VLQETGIAPSSLELELTESVLMQDTDRMVDLLRGLADLGVRIAIDDFGTGYSSLSYLKRFAIHKLKIDRAFVRDIPANSNDVALTGAIIAMAHALQMQVIAEGVETDAQYRFLRDQGCDEMQGFLLGAPLTAQELICMGNASDKDWRPAGV
jgi:EAL domain-containing protein (putative c-di-GMP-specific phosphodiesterase class I)